MSLLVYALASREVGPLRLRGVRAEHLETVRVGPIDAIVGTMTTPPRPTARVLRQYDHAIRALWARRFAVLPARFPSVMRDRSELELTLRVRQSTFRRQLALVRHRAQMTVRLVPGSGVRGVGSGPQGPRSARSPGPSRGTRYLMHRAGVARLEHISDIGVLRAAVKPWIRAERADAHAGVATVYHLVPRTSVPRYQEAIARAAAAAHMRVQVSGPWPAYAFAEAW
jgi:hypothetical protein